MEVNEKWFVIINPTAGRGRGLTDWPYISKLLRDHHVRHEYAFTERKYHATELAVEAIGNGFRQIIIVGGDGTIHEVVNGIFVQQQVPTREVLLAVIAVGTGNDWIRMFGIARKYSEAIRAIVERHSFLQDVGRVTYYESNYRQTRYMANVAGVGFDAFVIKRYVHGVGQGRGGRWIYLRCLLQALLKYHSTGVKMWIDDEVVVKDLVFSATIGIGRYNGGGMLQVPEAVPDDGLFDVTVIRRMSLARIVYDFKLLFNGNIYRNEKVSMHRGRRIRFDSSPDIFVEVDGELLGNTPVEFEIIDRAIRVVVAERFLRQNQA